MLQIRAKGDFRKTKLFLRKNRYGPPLSCLSRYGEKGVAALEAATPVDTGKTAASWKYEIKRSNKTITVSFHNTNVQNGTVVALVLQYGHGTPAGYWVEGRDYINPAIQPIFDELADEAFQEIMK